MVLCDDNDHYDNELCNSQEQLRLKSIPRFCIEDFSDDDNNDDDHDSDDAKWRITAESCMARPKQKVSQAQKSESTPRSLNATLRSFIWWIEQQHG